MATNMFKPIRDAAEATDAQPDDDELALATANGDAGDDGVEHPVQEIESLCMQCHENGTTSLMMTMIPYFKEVVIMAFSCPHCGFRNNEVTSAGRIQDLGATYTVKVTTREDLNRQLVKSEYSTLSIPEYELTLPPGKGQLTTIESIIRATIDDLEFEQPVRQHTDAETHAKIEAVLNRLRPIVAEENDSKIDMDKPFTVMLEDPSGNSFIEAKGGFDDLKWSKKEFKRTPEQNEQLGIGGDASAGMESEGGEARTSLSQAPNKAATHLAAKPTLTDDYFANPDEVFSFPDVCTSCGATLETYMKTVDIPHFKEVVLMSTNCHSCGYKDNEIKSGGAIADKGKKLTLKVEDAEDLARDILKSETASLTIPDIDLHLHPGTLGGRFTTLEGLLQQVYEELDEKVFAGDSAEQGGNNAMETFLGKLKQARDVAIQYTIILDDPLSNSYIQNIYAPDDDPNLEEEIYERTHDQNEDLGLNDILVEGYEGEEEAKLANEAEMKKEADAKAASEQEAKA